MGGGMGVVYKALYTKTNQIVALKLLPGELSENPRLVARFERELEILKKLKHKNIVPCYGGGQLGKQRYFAMELVEGGSLSELIKKRGRLSWEDTVRYGRQICAALEHAHEHAIIHRDLKPANLLLTKDGTLKLADFGIARDIDATGLTATGKTVGTFAYMAPEQIQGQSQGAPPVSHKTDLYALGCVLFEFITGRPPFLGDSSAQIMLQHLESTPPRASSLALDCPIWLDTLITRLLQKNPAERPRDAAAVSQALDEIEQKVAERASVAQHTVSGGPTGLNVTAETDLARKLLKRKKKKKVETGPFWQKTWFLTGCLAAVAALFVWALWPASEDKLFEQARVLMESDQSSDWRAAYERPLEEIRRRFPRGKHAEQVQQYVDKFEMHRAEERHKNNNRLGREPANEGERLYAQARQYELFGDLVSAQEKYQSMIEVLKDQPELRPFVNLARRQLHQIESLSGEHLDRRKIVDEALARADQLYFEEKGLEARKIWNSIISLYETNRELAPQLERARSRLAGKDPGLPPTESNPAIERSP